MIRNFQTSDIDAIVHVRTHVIENHLSVEQMAAIGITPQSVQADIAVGDLGCWVAEDQGRVVAFSMADRRDGNIFVRACQPCPQRRRLVPVAKITDVLAIHPRRLPRIARHRQALRTKCRLARLQVGRPEAAMPQFDAGQRAMGVHGLHHSRHAARIVVHPTGWRRVREDRQTTDEWSNTRC